MQNANISYEQVLCRVYPIPHPPTHTHPLDTSMIQKGEKIGSTILHMK